MMFFIGKRRRGFETDYVIFETRFFCLFLTRTRTSRMPVRMVNWAGRRTKNKGYPFAKQVFLG